MTLLYLPPLPIYTTIYIENVSTTTQRFQMTSPHPHAYTPNKTNQNYSKAGCLRKTTSGPESITNLALKKSHNILLYFLSWIFNPVHHLGYTPASWKQSHIVIIQSFKDPRVANNYHSIKPYTNHNQTYREDPVPPISSGTLTSTISPLHAKLDSAMESICTTNCLQVQLATYQTDRPSCALWKSAMLRRNIE